jgi:Protein of unknown function, DUF488
VEIYSIGFTQTTAERFFKRLSDAGIARLLDVRLNNTSQLAGFAKAKDLPYFLRELIGATYEHQPLLAPTQDLLDDYKKRKGDWATYETRFLGLRMKSPRICLAGVDMQSLEHVRPTTYASEPITRELLRQEGGPFEMGAVVELGSTQASPTRPETEDHRFRTTNARFVEVMDGDEFLTLLGLISSPDLSSAFGPALERLQRNYAVERGSGDRSLAVVRAPKRCDLEVDRYGKLRLQMDDVRGQANVSVTDLRFYREDQKTPRDRVVQSVRLRLKRGVAAFLMLGLARAYRARDDDRERHWLQLNGLCLEDRPTGDTP